MDFGTINLIPNALAVALTVGIVGILGKYLTGAGKVWVALAVAIVASFAAEMYQGTLGINRFPLVALVSWLVAMGAWSGGKALSGK